MFANIAVFVDFSTNVRQETLFKLDSVVGTQDEWDRVLGWGAVGSKLKEKPSKMENIGQLISFDDSITFVTILPANKTLSPSSVYDWTGSMARLLVGIFAMFWHICTIFPLVVTYIRSVQIG